MKKYFGLMLIWFVFRTTSETNVVTFLNKLAKGTEFRICDVNTNDIGLQIFNVFYNANKEVK